MPFADIKGQDTALKILRQRLASGELGASFLFSGPEGVGKSLTATTVAQAVNCQAGGDDACGKCSSCLKIEQDQHPDVHIIDRQLSEEKVEVAIREIERARENRDIFLMNKMRKDLDEQGIKLNETADGVKGIRKSGGNEIKIEAIRQLQREIALKPYEGRKKVFIIRNAHYLTHEAANAFLKTLEEPPADSLIILIGEKAELLLRTIVSRCQEVKFNVLAREKLQELLESEYGVKRDLSHYLAYFCEGRIGTALRLKGTDVLREKNLVLDYYIKDKKERDASSKDKGVFRQQLTILATWLRDIVFLKAGMPPAELIHFDRREEIIRSARSSSLEALQEAFTAVSQAFLYLDQNINLGLVNAHIRMELSKL
jgi:DNA polymerase-3 subunit delta'